MSMCIYNTLYKKREDFNFHITNFLILSSNIQYSPAYGVFVSQLIRYARACSSYECCTLRVVRLSNKPIWQGYIKERWKSSLRKFYGQYGDLSNNMKSPSPECYTTFWRMTLYCDNLHWSGITPIFDPVTELVLIIEFYYLPNSRLPLNICNDMQTENTYSSGHLVL